MTSLLLMSLSFTVAVAPLRAGLGPAVTCGWDAVPAGAVLPPSVDRLWSKAAAEETASARDARALLERWFRDCDETAARNAILSLRKVLSRQASSPFLNALLGIALARGPDVQPVRATGFLYRFTLHNSLSEKEARRVLVRVAEQTNWPEAGHELAALALGTRNRDSLAEARRVLDALTRVAPDDAELWLARAEIAVAEQKRGDARVGAERAASLDNAAGRRVLGIIQLLEQRDAEGAPSYLDGLHAADALALSRYFEDLRPLLTVAELEQWQSLDTDSARSAWIERKWEWRASIATRTVAERLRVHFARIETADARYRRVGGARPIDALWLDTAQLQLPFDDRGLIHIRHGDADEVIANTSPALQRVAWVYFGLGGGQVVFEFSRLGAVDWALMKPLTCEPWLYLFGKPGFPGELEYERRPPRNARVPAAMEHDLLGYGVELGRYEPGRGAAAMRCLSAARRLLQSGELSQFRFDVQLSEMQMARFAQARANEVLRTENAVPVTRRPLRMPTSIYTFAGSAGTEVIAFLGVAGGDLQPLSMGPPTSYALRATLAVEHAASERTTRMDTTLSFNTPAPLAAESLVRTALTLAVPATTDATVRITLRNAADPEQGMTAVSSRDIVAYDAARFSISDVVIADVDGAFWRRGNVALGPLPGHTVTANGRFRLFYEVYGARAKDAIRTQIVIAPGSAADVLSRLRWLLDRREAFAIEFDDVAAPDADGTIRDLRSIGSELDPGLYVVTVNLTNGRTGDRATATTMLRIVEPR